MVPALYELVAVHENEQEEFGHLVGTVGVATCFTHHPFVSHPMSFFWFADLAKPMGDQDPVYINRGTVRLIHGIEICYEEDADDSDRGRDCEFFGCGEADEEGTHDCF